MTRTSLPPTAQTSSDRKPVGGRYASRGADHDGQEGEVGPQFNFGFEGLNLYQQRYERGGNQFSVEPDPTRGSATAMATWSRRSTTP